MKKIIITAFLTFLVFENIYADKFELFFMHRNIDYRVSYSQVKIFDDGDRNEIIFSGYTDNYGRIVVEIPDGKYNGIVYYQNKEWPVTFLIDGNDQELKTKFLNKPTQ